jgi:hypothetical protein
MSDSRRRPINTGAVGVQLTEPEAAFPNAKGERFHVAELSLAQAQEMLAGAQREYDSSSAAFRGQWTSSSR